MPRAEGREPRAVPKRAKPGDKIVVEVTYYCLRGMTRTDTEVREGIVAADPRVFPLRRHLDLTVRGRPLGRFLIADTGSRIKGHIVDVWVPSCAEARRRGRHHATAVLLTRAESRAERARQRKIEEARRREQRREQGKRRAARLRVAKK
jgi:3D (Asp-Asp-Asp) domain-containing protein